MSEKNFHIEDGFIEVIGAREHNLKNIDVKIPRNQLVVITGLSGSGKSSLAFDTIYAEGQRRYIETFSSYARQFLGSMERPKVDQITGLSPVISIEQKTVSKNPRSTVGTITEVYDYLRLLFARGANAYSYNTGEEMVKYTNAQIKELVQSNYSGNKILVLAPAVKGRKGHYKELFENIRKQGYIRVRVDGEIKELTSYISLDRYKIHDIEIVVDRIEVNPESEKRLSESINTALKLGKGSLMIMNHDRGEVRNFSKYLMCPTTGISYKEPEPNLFSFNSPYGACTNCNGLGEVAEVDIKKVIPDDKLSLKKGGIAPLGKFDNSWVFKQIEGILKQDGLSETIPVKDYPEEVLSKILNGTSDLIIIKNFSGINESSNGFEGVFDFIERHAKDESSAHIQRWANSFLNKVDCPTCKGTRLQKEALYFKILDKNISELSQMDISELHEWFSGVSEHLSENQKRIAKEIIKEIQTRLGFLVNVGLEYLTLNRSAKTLSGGEAQRIRLATQIGTELTGVLYILDEPSIGLHQRDNSKLIQSLKKLRDIGNSVIVVEHDKEMMLEADTLIDIGPGAGINGGNVLANGKPKEVLNSNSLTSAYINGKKEIEVPKIRRKGNGDKLVLKGASGHNLKNVDVEFPLGTFICVTGVSGSGKSSLINQTLYPILNEYVYNGVKKPLPYKAIKGLEYIDKVIEIDQSPIGRTPRSNPATYTGVFNEIRDLFALLPEAKIRGYKPGRFSFNVKGGRCETCKGAGIKTIEMNFLPDVYVECDSCRGKRYDRETLEVRYKGKSITDVLEMTIDDACTFFEAIPNIYIKLATLKSVGLGYITLGQPSTTLSGGEAQRVKLATELSKRETGQTFYILDEPSTGLHFEDIRLLLDVLQKLVDNGNTVLVIEHNLDIIKVADHIIDIGPEGGKGGGEVICTGTPEQVAKHPTSYTAEFLKREL
ncbi:MAG: excinuclease ABC subunit UvrA [Bacteroidia bacterium]